MGGSPGTSPRSGSRRSLHGHIRSPLTPGWPGPSAAWGQGTCDTAPHAGDRSGLSSVGRATIRGQTTCVTPVWLLPLLCGLDAQPPGCSGREAEHTLTSMPAHCPDGVPGAQRRRGGATHRGHGPEGSTGTCLNVAFSSKGLTAAQDPSVEQNISRTSKTRDASRI